MFSISLYTDKEQEQSSEEFAIVNYVRRGI